MLEKSLNLFELKILMLSSFERIMLRHPIWSFFDLFLYSVTFVHLLYKLTIYIYTYVNVKWGLSFFCSVNYLTGSVVVVEQQRNEEQEHCNTKIINYKTYWNTSWNVKSNVCSFLLPFISITQNYLVSSKIFSLLKPFSQLTCN